jgi:dTDP-4-amino-4,6-dideoxygalactose transaminase
MLNTTLPPWPCFSPDEAHAVANVILSNRVNYWTGEECRKFETEFADWCGSKNAVALNNGTVALDVALKAVDVGPGDEVIVTPRTFIASISCVVNAGARPVFADVDRDSGNVSPETMFSQITPKTKAIIPVHLAGWPCDMDGILAITRPLGIKVIEDCAQAHGAKIDGRGVGTFGDIGAWSFCQDKIITTGGEGGMVTTDDFDLWSKMWSYKDHGKSWNAVYKKDHPPGFRWLHESFGTNWRMLEVQAVLGRLQLKKLGEWTERRTQIASRIMSALDQFPDSIRLPRPGSDMTHAYYRLYAYVRPEALAPGWSRDRIISECTLLGGPVFQGSCSEVYLEKAFEGSGLRPEARLPNAKELGENSLMFLTHPNIPDEDVDRICDIFCHVISKASSN